MDVTKIKKFADIKALSPTDLIAYAKAVGGVDLDPTHTKDQLIDDCASIFLTKKEEAGNAAVLPPKEEKKKDTKAEISVEEQEEQEALDEDEDDGSWPPSLLKGQDHHRCNVCSMAITVVADVKKDPSTGKPICKDCLAKIKTKKERTKMATASAKKKEPKKAKAKAAGRKGNTAALAKARAAVPKDKYGFREGTNVSKLFAALLKGVTMDEAKKITGGVTSATMGEFKKSPKEHPRGRSAVIETSDKGVIKIKSHKVPAE